MTLSDAADWAQVLIGIASTVIALTALIVSRRALNQQQEAHAADMKVQQKTLRHQTFLQYSDLYNDTPCTKDLDKCNEKEVEECLNFLEQVGYFVAEGLLDKQIVEMRWGDQLTSLPNYDGVNERFHYHRCLRGQKSGWEFVEMLVKDFGDFEEPLWDYESLSGPHNSR